MHLQIISKIIKELSRLFLVTLLITSIIAKKCQQAFLALLPSVDININIIPSINAQHNGKRVISA
jgi:hypothetical protein